MKGSKVIRIQYYVDYDKVKSDVIKLGRDDISPMLPHIQNSDGLYWDLGIDLFAPYSFVVPAHTKYVINSYIGFLFEPGVGGLLYPRGGDDFLLGAGVIDTGYTGTIRSKIINPYSYDMTFMQGDSIGQLVLIQKSHVDGPLLQRIEQDQVGIITARGADGRITNEFSL